MTTQAQMFRDESRIVWVFEMVAGVERFGAATMTGKVRVDGYHAGLIAMDWLRDAGFEVIKTN